MITYAKQFLLFVWLAFAFLLGTLLSLVRWGNPNNMHDTLRLFAWGLLPIAGIRVHIEGLEHLSAHQPCIYVSNHQSGLDVAIFGKNYPPNTVTIGKKQLLLIPFFGLFFAASGNILIDRKNRTSAVGSLGQAARQIKERRVSIGIFPEGTRNRTGRGMGPFKKGAFHLAVEAGVPLVPYMASPIKAVFDKKTKRMGGDMYLKILPPIHIQAKSKAEFDEAVERTRKIMLDCYYELAKKAGVEDA